MEVRKQLVGVSFLVLCGSQGLSWVSSLRHLPAPTLGFTSGAGGQGSTSGLGMLDLSTLPTELEL